MLDGVFDLAANGPGMLRLLVDEPTLATRNALAARDRLLAEIESTIERDRPTARGSAHPDIPAKVLVGATLRLMLARLRENDRSLGELRGGLGRWVECYKHTGEPRRQTLAPVAGMRAGPPDYAAGLSEPQRPGRGRSRLTAEQTASNQRERLMYATASVTADKGYTESTVADIVAAAGLAREVFYRHFADRQDAFMSAYDTGFQALMALSVGAFYTSGDWPERIWAALGVYTDFMVNFPAFASLGMVESHTIAPEVVGRVDERVMAFTVFLEEGRRELQEDPGVAAVICEAIAMAIYEITSHTIRNGRGSELPGLLPLIAYVALAPFTGTDAANELIERKVRESREPRGIERRRGDLADRDRAR
jgi:AcrR family transcriptional regulator